jgi:hypothetical protein
MLELSRSIAQEEALDLSPTGLRALATTATISMDSKSPHCESPDSGSPGATSFRWEPVGKAQSIYVDFDVVDRLGFDIMRGFGAVPRRGAEVGGILLGSAEPADRTTIRIEDYVPVPCEHLRGPSYVLSDNDRKTFEETLERWTPAPDKRIYAIGFYRSNTRDSLELSPEDIELVDACFPQMTAICLLVKPYATRVSEAAFLTREAGRFSTSPAHDVFPFRRKELGGGRPTSRPRGMETADPELETAATGFSLTEENQPPPAQPLDPAAIQLPAFVAPVAAPAHADPRSKSRFRSGWVWIPLSFVFLLLGVVLGFQIALGYASHNPSPPPPDPYSLELSAVQFGENLHLKWNPEASVFRNASKGLLHIQDGDNSKLVELRQEDLSRGGVLYHNATNNVTFRLEVFPRDRLSVAESLELRLLQDRATSPNPPGNQANPQQKPEPKD